MGLTIMQSKTNAYRLNNDVHLTFINIKQIFFSAIYIIFCKINVNAVS